MRRTTTRTLRRAVAPAAVALLLLSGCGGDASDPVPTAGDVTGDTSVIETPTAAATEPTTEPPTG